MAVEEEDEEEEKEEGEEEGAQRRRGGESEGGGGGGGGGGGQGGGCGGGGGGGEREKRLQPALAPSLRALRMRTSQTSPSLSSPVLCVAIAHRITSIGSDDRRSGQNHPCRYRSAIRCGFVTNCSLWLAKTWIAFKVRGLGFGVRDSG